MCCSRSLGRANLLFYRLGNGVNMADDYNSRWHNCLISSWIMKRLYSLHFDNQVGLSIS